MFFWSPNRAYVNVLQHLSLLSITLITTKPLILILNETKRADGKKRKDTLLALVKYLIMREESGSACEGNLLLTCSTLIFEA